MGEENLQEMKNTTETTYTTKIHAKVEDKR